MEGRVYWLWGIYKRVGLYLVICCNGQREDTICLSVVYTLVVDFKLKPFITLKLNSIVRSM